jgi:hypothetical protein
MKHFSSKSKVKGGSMMPLDHFDKSLHSHTFPHHEVHSSIHDTVISAVKGGAKRSPLKKSPKSLRKRTKTPTRKGRKGRKGRKAATRKGRKGKIGLKGGAALPMSYFNPSEKGGFVDTVVDSYRTAYEASGLRALAPGSVIDPSSGQRTG